jgi:hypothetical protein
MSKGVRMNGALSAGLRFGRLSGFRSGQAGQALVMGVLALVASLAMVAVIVDGGNAWAHYRVTQNGSDASAEAGAVILGEKSAGSSTYSTDAQWDGAVSTAVSELATSNGITVPKAYYTDVCGNVLTLSNNVAKTDFSNAVLVGGGSLPATTGANCTLNQGVGTAAGSVAGVKAFGSQTFRTYIAGVIGMSGFTANATATAVSGPQQGGCAATSGNYCLILPLSIWYQTYTCDNSGNFLNIGSAWSLDPLESTIPLCKAGSGNIGWISWTGNSSSGMGNCSPGSGVIGSICYPDNDPVTLPQWLVAGQTGNSNSSALEDAINEYAGQSVLLPMDDLGFSDATKPASATGTSPYGCTNTSLSGSGNYFHVPQFAAFKIDRAYVSGSNASSCGYVGNGSNGCLTGWFEGYTTVGAVCTADTGCTGGNGEVFAIQLIK